MKTSSGRSISSKNIMKSYIQNKQNIYSNMNRAQVLPLKDLKILPKTGIDIKNRIRNKDLNILKAKDLIKSKQNKPNILQDKKIYQRLINHKIQQAKQVQQLGVNLSRQSSSSSIKSVSFSINSVSESCHSSHTKKSILKNRIKSTSCLESLQKRQTCSFTHSLSKPNRQQKQDSSSNSIIYERYIKILKELKITNQKYSDKIFPPCHQSICLRTQDMNCLEQSLSQNGLKIKWMRINQLFKNKKTTIWSSHNKSIITKGYITNKRATSQHIMNQQLNPQHYKDLKSHDNTNYKEDANQDQYLQTVLNSINKNYLMEKFFQSQQINNSGIYYVKIHQTLTNTWKYVIIDDFIPVIVTSNKSNSNQLQQIIKPAFLNVQTNSQILEIWPFLLQKAYAKYYSAYDSLKKGKLLDFAEQITGNFYQTIDLGSKQNIQNRQKESNLQQYKMIINNPFNIVFIETYQQKLRAVIKIEKQQIHLIYYEKNKTNQIYYSLENLYKYSNKIHFIQPYKHNYHKTCLIHQQSKFKKNQGNNENITQFILKSFKLQENTDCVLALIQKQQRFHPKKTSSTRNITAKTKNRYLIQSKYEQTQEKAYKYSWMRMILVVKDSSGYRWIDGQYGNSKTLKLNIKLAAGQYFIIIIPEWYARPFDLNLTLFTDSNCQLIQPVSKNHHSIIEQSCMDLSQRYGKLIQINPNICAYNYIDYKMGFIIENINNQKSSGEVKILRTIDGLIQFGISPINKQFQGSNRINVKIKPLQAFTVVLKTQRGVDKQFLKQFDFGS